MSNQLPILYARGNKGQILEWRIEIRGNKFRTITGAQGHQHVVSEFTTCEGKNVGKKNATTPEEQAYSEAQSRWEKKQKSGGYWEDIKDIDKIKFVEPMLAKNLKDRLKKIDWKKGVLVQNKFNGFRCVATFDGENVILKSRKGELYVSIPHINEDLKHFFTQYPNAVLDGELFNNEYRQKLNEISKLVTKTEHITEEDLQKSERLVRYFVYDGYGMTNDTEQSVGYEIRKNWIDGHLPELSKYYQSVKSDKVYSLEEINLIFNDYVKDGQEGVIVRIPDAPYENKRSSNLLKYKPQDSAECVILDILEGEGNWSGAAKTATVKWNGKIFDATFLKSYETNIEVLKNKSDWIGKEVTFLYVGLTGLGTPNSARIDPENCFEGTK
jgi:DNA ligase-1